MKEIYCDVLVIGGGAAGSRAAYEAKRVCPELKVIIAVMGTFETGGSTNMVASEALGINAPFNYEGDGDTPEIYLKDMLETGGGLSNPVLCQILAQESIGRIEELMDMGVQFISSEGHPWQQKLSGCTKARSLTSGGSTGRQITSSLKKAALNKGVILRENTHLVKLIQNAAGQVIGAVGTCDGVPVAFHCRTVVLATGGAGSLFSINVTPPSQTGDGWAMAYEVGCRFVNMEFFQIGPAIAKPGLKFIIHSNIWRFLPKLTNRSGETFLAKYCPHRITPEQVLELKAMSYPFSVRTDAKYVDIAIFNEIVAGRGGPNGGVFFDITHVPKKELLEKAPITYYTLLKTEIDCTNKPIELTVAVQNFNGGILVDENGFTGIKGLYAAGEVTGGVHGSDRPGGNNLTDTQVFGYRAGQAAAIAAREISSNSFEDELEDLELELLPEEQALTAKCEELYYRELTVVRRKEGLQNVLDFVNSNFHPGISVPFHNRLIVGYLLATSQLTRTESRGTHYREDYPETDPAWCRRIIYTKGLSGEPKECPE